MGGGVRRARRREGFPDHFVNFKTWTRSCRLSVPPSVSPSFSISSSVPKEGGRASGVEKGSCMQGHPGSAPARPPTDWKAAKMDKVVK